MLHVETITRWKFKQKTKKLSVIESSFTFFATTDVRYGNYALENRIIVLEYLIVLKLLKS